MSVTNASLRTVAPTMSDRLLHGRDSRKQRPQLSTVARLCSDEHQQPSPRNHPIIVDGDLFTFAPCGCCYPKSDRFHTDSGFSEAGQLKRQGAGCRGQGAGSTLQGEGL
ncbi:hypothetical protein [Fischerella sp. PCC 9605]|uniref:hypothetical protein n=1 Tax=Fischerella sp. PCC 9605 TaxID=1173024 RepID=UPI00047B039B|nr:hypothetical protein [Fischerella sp. PCC 9605]